jgi:hypothetical protein
MLSLCSLFGSLVGAVVAGLMVLLLISYLSIVNYSSQQRELMWVGRMWNVKRAFCSFVASLELWAPKKSSVSSMSKGCIRSQIDRGSATAISSNWHACSNLLAENATDFESSLFSWHATVTRSTDHPPFQKGGQENKIREAFFAASCAPSWRWGTMDIKSLGLHEHILQQFLVSRLLSPSLYIFNQPSDRREILHSFLQTTQPFIFSHESTRNETTSKT